MWVGAGSIGRSGRVALYFREDAAAIGPPAAASARRRAAAARGAEHELLRARLAQGPCFFSDLLAELDAPAEALREALWDLVWAGEATNDAWAPLRAPHLALARGERAARVRRAPARAAPSRARALRARRGGTQSQVQGRWSLTGPVFAGAAARARRARRSDGACSPSCCSSATGS